MSVCPICGRRLTRSSSNIDHIIPKAIFKWLEHYLSNVEQEFLKSKINSEINKVPVHRRCNSKKQSVLLSCAQINYLYLEKEKKQKIKILYRSLSHYTNIFQKKINKLARKQNWKCYYCKQSLNQNSFVIRRIDWNKERIFENNGCLTCRHCSNLHL